MKSHEWIVIGSGPSGILAITELINNKINPQSILWISKEFHFGNLTNYPEVPANTKAKYLQAIFNSNEWIYSNISKLELTHKNPNHYPSIGEIKRDFEYISCKLPITKKVDNINLITKLSGYWQIIGKEHYSAKKIILCTGGKEKDLEFHPENQVSLNKILNLSLAKHEIKKEDKFLVFGNSHTSILAIMNLNILGIKDIVNVYKSNIKYAIETEKGILYDNTGLKGEVAHWCKHNYDSSCKKISLEKFLENKYGYENYKIINGTGIVSNKIKLEGIQDEFDAKTGIINSNLFGCGLAYPEEVLTAFGHLEKNIGIAKFYKFIKSNMPIWINY